MTAVIFPRVFKPLRVADAVFAQGIAGGILLPPGKMRILPTPRTVTPADCRILYLHVSINEVN